MANARTIPLLSDDDEANPYNARKEWQEGGEAISQTADELYIPPRKKAEPKAPATATSVDDNTDNHDYKKRWSDLKKLRDSELKAWEEEKKAIEARLKALESGPTPPPEGQEDLQKWIQDNPDLFKMVKTVVQQETNESTKTVKQQLDEITQKEKKLAMKAAKQEVLKVHSDLDEITADESFHDWAESQPEPIQKMIYENPTDYKSLIAALDLYKAYTGKGASKAKPSGDAKETDGADALVSVRSVGQPTSDKKIWTRQEIDRMSMEDFDKYEEEINRAVFEGRVV